MNNVGRHLAVFAAAIGAMSCQHLGVGNAAKLGGREMPAIPVLAAEADEVTLNRQWAKTVFSATPEPFSFTYGGRASSELIRTWKRSTQEERIDAATLRRTLALTDPETGLEVRARATIYTDTPGVDWTLHFTNKGTNDTPVLEQVKAVNVLVAPGADSAAVLHRLRGSTCSADDWQPFDVPFPPGARSEFGAVNGRSSAECPFFNLDWGTGGVITAVG